MKMLKKLAAVIVAAVCVLGIGAFAACDAGETESALNNIEASGIVYVENEQPVFIEGCAYFEGEEPARFKNTITASDIVLSQELAGKTVKSVEYVDASNLVIYLEGTATNSFEGDKVDCKITIKGTATQNGKDSFCFIFLRKPKLTCTSCFMSVTSGMYNCLFSLPYGNFIAENATIENVTIVGGGSGTIEKVEVTESGNLRVKVTGFSSQTENYPTIKLSESVTSFGKELTIKMAVYSTTNLD